MSQRRHIQDLYAMLLVVSNIFEIEFDTIIDIGCGYGEYSSVYSKFFNRVICFEPNSSLIESKIHSGRIEYYPCALYSIETEKEYYSFEHPFSGLNTITPEFLKHNAYEIENVTPAIITIKTKTLDSFNFTNINYIKIDTEGSDFEILKGAIQTILKNRPVIQTELIDVKLDKFLESLEYTKLMDEDFFINQYGFRDSLYLPNERLKQND